MKPADPKKLLDLGSWGFWALVVLGISLFLGTTSVAAYRKNAGLHAKVRELEADIAARERANHAMEGEKTSLSDDPAYIERIVRREFRRLGPDEYVIDMRASK
jgi:cell division protein FtsB